MNTRNKITSSIAGGLAALVMTACSGGSDPDPKPPAPSLNSTISLKVKNLDNPGSTEYMTGDRTEYTATAAVSVSNPSAGMDPASIYSVEYRFNPGQTGYDVTLTGNSVPNFSDVRVIGAPNVSTPTQKTLEYKVVVNDPTVASKSTTLTGNGDTMSLKPVNEVSYDAATIKPKVLAHIDELAQMYADFGTVNGRTYPADAWKASLLEQFDGIDTSINPETTSHKVSFTTNGIVFYQTQNATWEVRIPRDKVYAVKKIYDN